MKHQDIILEIINREGGYVNHPADRGGPTKFGITLKTLNAYTGMEHDAESIKHLTPDDAYMIYYTQYYLRPKIHLLPQPLLPLLTDCSVHHGPATAIKFLQTVCANNNCPVGAIDGIIGPKTTHAAEKLLDENGLTPALNALIDMRIQYMRRIVENDPTQSVFIDGWINRAESFR